MKLIEWIRKFLHDVLDEKFNDVKIRGFRAPYYNFDPDIPKILETFQYSWDSTKGYFPILNSHFKMERFGKIAELPSLFPDDITLLDRMGLNENQVLKIWKKTFDISKDTLIWGIHPYISAKNPERIKMLKHFIDYINGSLEQPLISLEDGIKVLQIALAAKQSSQIGRVTPL